MRKKLITLLLSAIMTNISVPLCTMDVEAAVSSPRYMEHLERGVVAVRSSSGAFISWRLLALDPEGIGFNVYKSENGGTPTKLNSSVLTGGTNYTDKKYNKSVTNTYFVEPVIDGVEQGLSEGFTISANSYAEPCYKVPLNSDNTSEIRNVWVGDLNGDGEYDFVLTRNGEGEGTSQQVEGYTNKGELLWSIDLGENSYGRDSATASTVDVGHWDGVTVYDMDCDGKAEVMIRIASGVTFADGYVWYEEEYKDDLKNGHFHQSFALVDGMRGTLIDTAPLNDGFIERGPKCAQMAIGYLDGKTPSLITWTKNRNSNKSYNSYTTAYHVKDGEFVEQWTFENLEGTPEELGADRLGEAHQMRIVDLDKDGKDEVAHIGYVIESDGSFKYNIPGICHGDRFYIGQFMPDGDMHGYGVQQTNKSGLVEYYYNAKTGKIIWENYQDVSDGTLIDNARGDCGDIDPTAEGWECFSYYGTYNGPTGELLYSEDPYPSIGIWWDSDLFRESTNDAKIEKFNYDTRTGSRLLTTWKYPQGNESGVGSRRNHRSMPIFVGDIIGDWREEVIMRGDDDSYLAVFTTDIATDKRIYTLAQNPLYRNCMTIKGYVESHQLDYYLGSEMKTPPVPNIQYVSDTTDTTQTTEYKKGYYKIYRENFERESHRFTSTKESKEYFGVDTAVLNSNTTNVYAAGNSSASYYLFDDRLEDEAWVSLDFRMDGAGSGKTSYVSILDSANTSSTYDEEQAALELKATSNGNGYWSAITLNGIDITEKAYVKTPSESGGYGGLSRGSTGWLNMEAEFDFNSHMADVVIKRKSDGSVVYEGEIKISKDIDGIQEIYLLAGNKYGAVFVDNVNAGTVGYIPDLYSYIDEDFEGRSQVFGTTNTSKQHWDEDASENYGFASKIYGAYGGVAAYAILDDILDNKAYVSMDIRMDGVSSGQASRVALIGKENKTTTFDYDSSIVDITAIADGSGYWGTITINDEDITSLANITSPSESGSSLKRDSTGWLNLEVVMDFEVKKADVVLTRVAGESVIYAKTIDISENISGLKELYIKSGNGYGGVYIDNVEVASIGETVVTPMTKPTSTDEPTVPTDMPTSTDEPTVPTDMPTSTNVPVLPTELPISTDEPLKPTTAPTEEPVKGAYKIEDVQIYGNIISVDISKLFATNNSAICIIATYNEYGMLTGVNLVKESEWKNNNDLYCFEADMNEVYSVVKVFVWDSVKTMEPCDKCMIIN